MDKIFDISNKVVVLTGAGGHLISNLAIDLSKLNTKLCLVDLNFDKFENYKDIKSLITNNTDENNAMFLKANVSRKKDFTMMLQETLKKFGTVDVLVNGAGINSPKPFFEIQPEEWDNILRVQLTSIVFGCQIFGEFMKNNKHGSIINISSASSGPPLSKAFAYSVAKAGVKNLTQNLGREFAQYNVKVNCIRPGFFPSEYMNKNFLDKDRKNAILNHTPMKRFGEPSELTGAFILLMSDASSFMTGSEITIDGGFSAMTI